MEKVPLYGHLDNVQELTDFYVYGPNDLADCKIDVNVIADTRYLQYINGVHYEEDKYIPPLASEWYPKCNSYYPYTEDVDPENRVDHIREAKQFLESFTTIKTDRQETFDPFTKDDAHLKFLNSKPATFIVLGKPGIGEHKLAKVLAEHWRCVYIDPEILITEEIESGSRSGQCIEFNLRCGRAIAVDVILKLLEKRVRTKSASHRGFVISGFPLIKNDMFLEDPVSSESAVFTVHDIFEEVLDTIGTTTQLVRNVSEISHTSVDEEQTLDGDEDVGEDDDVNSVEVSKKPFVVPNPSFDIGSTNSQMCKVTSDIGSNYAAQVNFLFGLCHEPLIIIYLMCPNFDVVTKHENIRYNIKTEEFVNLLKDQTENIVYTIYTKNPGFENDDLPDDMLDIPGTTGGRLSSSDHNYLMYLPGNFSGNVQKQLDSYRFGVLPTIEKHVLLHDPEYFIKVDGRLSPNRMFNILKTRLRLLPIPSVVLPERLIDIVIPTGGEGDEVETYDYDSKSPDECFDMLKRRKTVGRMFKLKWSKWGSSCPVSMKEGTYYDGKAKNAVKFLDRIFFLSDEEAMLKFIRNPRPYLTPPCPRPTCKIYVIGPPVSGKSAIAKCLALLLDGRVLDSISMQLQYTQQKEKEYLEKVRSDAINEALAYLQEQRRMEYEEKESQRKKDKDKWIIDSVDFVNERTFLDMQMRVDPVAEMTAFPLKAAASAEINPEMKEQFQSRMEELQEKMCGIGLSMLFEDVNLCYKLLTEDRDIRKEILSYLPDYLNRATPFPEPPDIFDSFVTDFIAEKVENRIKVNFDTTDDLVDMFLTAIRETEESNIEVGSYHGGWVVDGMIPEPAILDIVFEEFIPNDIFVFRDSSGRFLQDRYKIKGQNTFMDYCGFFEALGKTDVAMKSPSVTTTYSYKTRFARSIIDDALTMKIHDLDSIPGELEYGEEPMEFVDEDYFATHATRMAMQEYDNSLKAYENKITEVLTYLDDRGIPYSIIDLGGKPLEKLMKEVVTQVDSRYQLTAKELTPNDRAEEVDDFGEPAMMGEDMGEEDAGPSDGDVFTRNRRLGMTNVYCPVAYHSYWVLWKGKEEFAAKYDDEIFFMSGESALRLFIQHPQEYLHTLPPERIPPPRICIIGVQGCGKTILSQKLCRELGLYYVGFDELLKKLVHQEHNPTELRVILDHIPETPEVIMVQNYLDKGEPLPEDLRDLLNLQRLWYEEPIKSTGFVLDGYPRRPPDLEYMETNFLIPDLILELNCDDIEVNRRRVQRLVHDWQILHDHEHEEREKKYMADVVEWEEQRKARIEELMEIKRQERYQAKIQELKDTPLPPVQEVSEDEEERATARSQVSYNSVAEEADLEEINNIVKTEFPEPVLVEDEETNEDATDRFILYAQQEYAIGLQFFNLIRDCANDVQIDVVPIDADVPIQKVFDQAMRAVDHVKFRNRSILERCYDINVETAERLISNGYYFLSRFGKMCPVQLYEKDNPFHMFIPLEQKFEIFPVIHRYFIYFLAGKSNRTKFMDNPLKYTLQQETYFPIIPWRLAIIGPPKSGKTSMCERFKRDYGMKHISIGQAVRYVLRYLPFSKLAHEVESVLREGWELTSEMTMRCVEAMAFDGRGITQGMVFDGFPNSRFDVKHLAEIGLVPHLVFYLDADNDDIAEYLSTDKGKRGLPAFSKAFIQHRLEVWNSGVQGFLDFFDKEFQVWTKVPVKTCKWGIWEDVYKVALDVVFEIKSYYRNCNREMGLLLANMQVTPTEFMKRQSFFKTYCPCCLHYDDSLVGGVHPPDRTGLVQYKDKYYFLCNKHLKEFSDDPPSYLSPYNTKTLPDDLPFIVNLESTPPDCYMDGFCIVCYWDAQPHRLLNPGSFEFACSYKDTIYIFDTRECLMLFMMLPHKYFRKQICFKGGTFASLDMNNLPVQGFLEQYVSRDIIRAVSNCGFTRPVIGGLGIAKSAAINMGLLLKIHNPKLPQDERDSYVKASEVFKERRLTLINHLALMKKSINPFLHYEEPLEPLQTGEAKYESSESDQRSPGGSFTSMLQQVLYYMQQPDEARRVPVPDERFDYLCEYFKPASKVPAFLNVVDIAGLVKGASEGQGLGNAFLSHISACDAIFHLCRVFEDDDVTHVEGDVNPVRDLEIISEELRLKDEEQLIKHLDKLERTAIRGNDKKLKPEYDAMLKVKTVLVDQKQHIRFADWHVNDIEILNKYLFLTSKPMIYLVNLSEKDYIKKKNKWLVKIKEWIDKNDPGAIIIPFSGAFEFRLIEEQDPELRKKIQTDAGATSALDKIIIQGYKALQLEYFFTSGADEVKAWTIAKGTKAPQAAGKIHTDFEKGFIMAEVMKYQDFKEEGSEAATKAAGKYRQQGRNYVVEDGDIIFFKFNAGAGIKDGKKK